MNHIRMKYGKYLNKIDTEIPVEHILVERVSDISRSVEPGEPNLPSPESYTIQIANLNPDGSQRYPLSFWQDASRQEEEGATQELQLYIQIFVDDQPQFTGVLKRVRYAKYDTVCSLEMRDLTDLLRTEERTMFKSFEFDIPRPLGPVSDENLGIIIDGPNSGYNDLPPLKSLDDETIPHETLTFQLFVGPWSGGTRADGRDGSEGFSRTGQFNEISNEGQPAFPFAWHLGWQELPYVTPVGDNDGEVLAEQIRPAYVQIGDITVFTRIRLWVIQNRNDANSRSRQECWISIWHNATAPSGGVIPRGRFIWDSELITTETEEMKLILHEPNFGYDEDVAINAGLLPHDKNFIFGLPFINNGTNIQLTSDEYAYFDVLEKTREIINADVSTRHTDQGLSGWIEVTDFDPNANEGDKASASIAISYVPSYDTEYKVEISKPDGYTRFSYPLNSQEGMTMNDLVQAFILQIDAGPTGEFWDATQTEGNEFTITAKDEGEEWNFYRIYIYEKLNGAWQVVKTPNFPTNVSTTGGTTGGYVADSIDFLIGINVFATTPNIEAGDTLADIAKKIYDAAVAVGDAELEFTLDGERVNVVSYRGAIQGLSLNVGTTNVEWDSETLSGSYDIFDVSKLRDEYRLAFYSDVIMFGWLEKTVIECLVAVGWQTSSHIFTTADGKIAIHSRDFYETFPNNVNDPDFQATLIEDAAWEPASGNTYDEGFSSYEAEVFQDIIEVNNVRSRQKRKIYADKDGERSRPSLNNKKVNIGNYRIHDLSVTFQGVPYRYSPGDEIWSGSPLAEFLPTGQEQLNILARTFPFPITATTLRIYWPDYQDVDGGGYVWGQDSDLWLVKNIRINPRSLVATLDIEFKKTLTDFGNSFTEGAAIDDIVIFGQFTRETYEEGINVAEQPISTAHDFSEQIAASESPLNQNQVITDEILLDAEKEIYEITVSEQYIENVGVSEIWTETVTPPET